MEHCQGHTDPCPQVPHAQSSEIQGWGLHPSLQAGSPADIPCCSTQHQEVPMAVQSPTALLGLAALPRMSLPALPQVTAPSGRNSWQGFQVRHSRQGQILAPNPSLSCSNSAVQGLNNPSREVPEALKPQRAPAPKSKPLQEPSSPEPRHLLQQLLQ